MIPTVNSLDGLMSLLKWRKRGQEASFFLSGLVCERKLPELVLFLFYFIFSYSIVL